MLQTRNIFHLGCKQKARNLFCLLLLTICVHANAQNNIREEKVTFACDSLIVDDSVLRTMDSIIFCANVVDTVWWYGLSIYELFSCFNLHLGDLPDDKTQKDVHVLFNSGIEYSDGIVGYFKLREYYVYVHNDWGGRAVSLPDCFVRSGKRRTFKYVRRIFVGTGWSFEMGDDDIPGWEFHYKDGKLNYWPY